MYHLDRAKTNLLPFRVLPLFGKMLKVDGRRF